MKSLYLTIFIILSFLFISDHVKAQKNFKPGFIITGSQDTLHGLIDYRNWSKNPELIHFKKDPTTDEKTLRIPDISFFTVENEQYVRAVVSVNNSPYKTGELSASRTPLLQKDTVMLRMIVDGPKRLFYLRDHNDKEHFYINQTGTYELLINHRYKPSDTNLSGVITVEVFRDQLKTLLSDCPPVQRRLTSATYSQTSLRQIFEIYYENCGEIRTKTITKRDKFLLHSGLLAGISVSKIHFTGTDFPYLTNVDFTPSIQPVAGAFLNIVFPRTQQKLSLLNELLYTNLKIDGQFREYNSDQYFSVTDVSMKFGYIKLNTLVRYKLPVKSIDFYINLGLSNSYLASQKNYKRREARFYSDLSVTEGKAMESVRKYEQGIVLGLSGAIAKISLELRGEVSNGMSPSNGLSSQIRRFYTLIAYRF